LLNFHIEDTGIGIESEKIDNVFEVFHQEDGRISRDFGGTGLGLSISKKLAEALGGDILVVSEKHKGSTFSFRCRCEEVKGAEVEKDKSVIKDFEIQNFSVLVAEDNELNMKIIKRLLEKIGVNAEFVYNGSEAIEKTKTNHYDIIFMDMMMPVMDGLEATKNIKSASQGATPYIIACTANAIETEIEKCFAAGMDDFLSKPIMIDQLKKTINKALLSKESVS
jgi:CheY-like chemotaxis protein